MPSNHPSNLYSPLLLPPSIFSSIRVFSNKSVLCIRWPEYWSFSFSISPSNEYSGPISFRMDWLDLLAVQGTLKSLKCKVTWALGSITTNKASGGDGIPVELFQILKDDAVKVLHSKCQQIWETQQWPQDWKRSVFISIPKKGDAKECSNYHTVALISHASKVMLKILQASLQQFMNHESPYCFSSMLKLGQPLTPCFSLTTPRHLHTHTHSLSLVIIFIPTTISATWMEKQRGGLACQTERNKKPQAAECGENAGETLENFSSWFWSLSAFGILQTGLI